MVPTSGKKTIPFKKMHGLGNDFVIIDVRGQDFSFNEDQIKILGNRNLGIGFDQLVTINTGSRKEISAHLNFWNSDGSVSLTCGNATRCVADLLMSEMNCDELIISTDHHEIECQKIGSKLISTNLGQPKLSWDEIPLSRKCDTLSLPLEGNPVATSMGNPHCTYFVKDLEKESITDIGSETEIHSLFPQKTNVQIAEVIDSSTIKAKVWERGCGITLASGSSACAVAVASNRLGLTKGIVKIALEVGHLFVEWRQDGVWLTGPTAFVFSGKLFEDSLKIVS